MSGERNKCIADLFLYLRTNALFILCFMVIFGLGGYLGYRLFSVPMYMATTQVYIFQSSAEDLFYDDLKVASQLQMDYEALIKGQGVASEVIRRLDLDIPMATLHQNIIIEAEDNSRLMNLSYKHTDPIKAMQIANTIREVSVELVEDLTDIDVVKTVYEADIPQEYLTDAREVLSAVLGGAVLGIAVSVGGLITIFFVNYRKYRM